MSSRIINNTNKININNNNKPVTSLLEFDSNVPYNIFIRNLKLLRIGQVVVNFDITLEKNRIIFHGSPDDSKIRTVRGKVRLEVAGKLNVKEIILSLVGDYDISLDLLNDVSSSSLPKNQGTIFSSSILLENKGTLLQGVHDFHFEFLLPGDLPESMNSDAILCKYFLKAELITRPPCELLTENNKLVDIVDLFIERAMLESDDDIKRGLKPTRFIGGDNDLLDFEFILPKIMKLNSNSIELIARWDGFKRVEKISFCFVQSECYSIANHKCIAHNEKPIAGPFYFHLPKKEPLELQSRPMIFKLPICESFVNDYDLVNVKIRHQLNVKIQLSNFGRDQVEFSIPISIKSIIPNSDTLPLPRKIDLSNSVAYLQLGNKIYASKPSKGTNKTNKRSIFKLSSRIFKNNNAGKVKIRNNVNISTDSSIEPSLPRASSISQSKSSLSKKSSSFDIESKILNSDDNNVNISINNSNSNSNNLIHSSYIGNDDIILEEEEEDDDDDEYSEDYDDNIKANTTMTAATTITYTNNNNSSNNNKFNVKEFPKPNFITSSANIAAEKFIKFNYLLHQRHNHQNKNFHEDNVNDNDNKINDHHYHKPPLTKPPKRNSRISRASSTSTCVPSDVKYYIKNLNHYKSISNNNNSNIIDINDGIIS